MKLFAAMVVACVAICASAQAGMVVTVNSPASGDAQYAWNSKYGPYGYVTGSTSIGVGLYFGAPYGNDYTVSIFEIPISDLVGKPLISATLQVTSTGFGTGYYYGSANIGWLDVAGATGDVVADAMGPKVGAVGASFAIWNSDWGVSSAGVQSFDVTSCVAADLLAGRSYSTFVMSGSRDTYGSIYTAESLTDGPRIVANVVPEPATMGLLAGGALMLMRRRGVV